MAGGEEVDEVGERGEYEVGPVWERASHCFFRWLGHRPDGPGVEVLENEFTPFRMGGSGSFAEEALNQRV